ncbi:uncharacterized protein LOC112567486 [Pomacea canaliculata]|uniref:uncharacterized protein LOC112567486 n=1 Tax=Pomacea canaliculata TaxID=400727 RepID=UPI000D73C763|nr:uncharacterized protein LOC112567486 [Pomacea canaliculata]
MPDNGTIVRRTTSFNVFCSEKLKANPQGGFQAVEWGNQWRQLTDASKNEYAGKALAARNKKIDIKAIIKNIHSMFLLLKENEEEVKKSGVEGLCLITSKNCNIHFTEFGNMKGLSQTPQICNLITAYSNMENLDLVLVNIILHVLHYCFAFYIKDLCNVKC